MWTANGVAGRSCDVWSGGDVGAGGGVDGGRCGDGRIYAGFFPKALRRVLPENPLNTDTSTLTLRRSHLHTHTHWKSESVQVRSMPVSKYASVSMQA